MNPKRRNKLERERAELEQEYRSVLIEALRQCADGKWGLFGQNDGVLPSALVERMASPDIAVLHALEERIESVRNQLGMNEAFELTARLRKYRGRQGANAPGEPALARQFLAEIEEMEQRT